MGSTANFLPGMATPDVDEGAVSLARLPLGRFWVLVLADAGMVLGPRTTTDEELAAAPPVEEAGLEVAGGVVAGGVDEELSVLVVPSADDDVSLLSVVDSAGRSVEDAVLAESVDDDAPVSDELLVSTELVVVAEVLSVVLLSVVVVVVVVVSGGGAVVESVDDEEPGTKRSVHLRSSRTRFSPLMTTGVRVIVQSSTTLPPVTGMTLWVWMVCGPLKGWLLLVWREEREW